MTKKTTVGEQSDTDGIIVYCTVPSIDTGKTIAQELVKTRLVACASIIPNLLSIYNWNDQIHEDPECLMFIKSTFPRKDALIHKIKELHPYEVPEILVTSILDGYKPYLAWLTAETTDK
jgi:periplasmic divalent cation tolerance protein